MEDQSQRHQIKKENRIKVDDLIVKQHNDLSL